MFIQPKGFMYVLSEEHSVQCRIDLTSWMKSAAEKKNLGYLESVGEKCKMLQKINKIICVFHMHSESNRTMVAKNTASISNFCLQRQHSESKKAQNQSQHA